MGEPTKHMNEFPFRHFVYDQFASETEVQRMGEEASRFSNWDGLRDHIGCSGKVYCATPNKFPPAIRSFIERMMSPAMCQDFSMRTGIPNLRPDPYFEGGGIHRIKPGGWARIHTDYTWHASLQLWRRLNFLLYLNPDWQEEWQGHLELWSDKACEVRVTPKLNHAVLFETSDISFHGHPQALTCPADCNRNSIALYYFSDQPPAGVTEKRRGTRYLVDGIVVGV
jgi:Rps23 Pro-64 3,4-dihydroxylase Tpa1-like proline 4-hydroxylase